jgi:hypothetical protein
MTRDDTPPSASAGIFEDASAEVGRSTAIAHLDTSEVRWFAPGRPPADVIEWFSDGGSAGTTERRFDIYHLNSRSDVGTKRRSRRTVEVKVRGDAHGTLVLEAGLEGPLEEWRKWAPADGDPVWPSPEAPQVEVHKTVLTRTFTRDGDEVAGPASFDDHMFTGCDVEIAVLTVGAVESWTLAFEAFGPREDRLETVLAAWEALIVDAPADLGQHFGRACSYPEWLETTA